MVIRKCFQEEPIMNRVRGIEICAKNSRPPLPSRERIEVRVGDTEFLEGHEVVGVENMWSNIGSCLALPCFIHFKSNPA